MHIITRVNGFAVTDSNVQFLHRRLHHALHQLSDLVQRVVVRLSGIKHSTGVGDKRCHLQVQLQGMRDVRIDDVQPDLYMAITRSVDRAARTIMRRIARLRSTGSSEASGDAGVPARNRKVSRVRAASVVEKD